jgi:menaquinone-specific isochorismate synthase
VTDPALADVPRVRVTTRATESIDDVLAYADPDSPLYWMRRGDGIAGIGSALTWHLNGSPTGERMPRAPRFAQRWRRLAAAATVDDQVQLPGTGLVAFGAFSFDDRSARTSVLVVPRVLVGRRAGRSWITRIDVEDDESPVPGQGEPIQYRPYWSATLGPGAQGPAGYQDSVRAALEAIGSHEVGKVVLARDLVGTVPQGADLRRLARALAMGYPDCWTYAVDGIIGASPETLVTVSGGTVTARVLAGTAPRGADADADTAASLALATSAKDQDEHLYAVQSVLASLRPHTSALAASEQPFTLKLPNVFHLATDVEGELSDGASSLDLLGALHPTAAVAGSPTDAAIEVIRRLEPFDRGRYAGPVGWVDGNGDGEWAIALRCAQFDVGVAEGGAGTIPVTAHAGAGIVAGSDPEAELLETRVKFRPIVDALA